MGEIAAFLRRLTILMVGSGVVWGAGVAHGEGSSLTDRLSRITNNVSNVSSQISQLESELRQPAANTSKFDLEKRLVDATVFYGLGDFDKASILLFDLVNSPSFRTHSRYLDTKYKLGVCHFKAKNFRAAQSVLSDLARVRSNFQKDAIVLLVEATLNLGDDQGLDELIAQIERMGRSVTDEVRYVHGKALFRKRMLDKAEKSLSQVSPRSSVYTPARYYLGVIRTQQRDLASALQEFNLAVRVEGPVNTSPLGDDEDYGEVKQLARLGIARIHVENGNIEKALESYQSIDRRSDSFEVALYEMAWVMAREERFERALHTLEVLVLIADNDRLLADANNMKSRILMKLNRYEEAASGYGAVMDNFSPIQRELSRVARSDERLDDYFEWLIERNVSGFDTQRPMTEKAAKFVEKSTTIRPVASVFDQLGEEESTLAEAALVARELETALGGEQRYDLIPRLAEKWGRVSGAENDLIRLRSNLLELEHDLAVEHGGLARAKSNELRLERQKAEVSFQIEAPSGPVDYKKREEELERIFRAVERESFLSRQLLERARRQLNSVEVWLADPKQTGLDPGGIGERKARMRLDEERKTLAGYNDELIQLANDIELASVEVGVVDLERARVGGLKTKVIRLQEKEREYLRSFLTAAEGKKPLLVQELRKLRRTIRDEFKKTGRLSGVLDKRLSEGLAVIKREVSREVLRLSQYENALEKEVRSSRDFVKQHGYVLFRDASDELRDVVLEADLGLIDVSWERKRQESVRIQTLLEERNTRIRELDNSLDDINRDRKAGLVGTASPAGQSEENEE